MSLLATVRAVIASMTAPGTDGIERASPDLPRERYHINETAESVGRALPACTIDAAGR